MTPLDLLLAGVCLVAFFGVLTFMDGLEPPDWLD